MSLFRVPVPSGRPYMNFSVTLSGRVFTISMRWLYQYSFYAVDVYEAGEPVTLGRGLFPAMDIFQRVVGDDLGQLYLSGEDATIGNLGVANELLYQEP